jgi:DnaK suppressor protein
MRVCGNRKPKCDEFAIRLLTLLYALVKHLWSLDLGMRFRKYGGARRGRSSRASRLQEEGPFPGPMTNPMPMAETLMRPRVKLPEDYRPSENEPFMSDRQRAYFRRKLLAWREEILRSTKETLQHLHDESEQHADIADRATSETERALELRARDRQRKLIAKIDAAIVRLDDGSYGYCEETGDQIGLKRLDARPIATLSVEAQERHEQRERVYRDE